MAIYYLDVDDEITGAVARLRASSDYRVALVLPAGSRVATSRINFKLLAREAEEHQRRLAVLSPEASVRSIAEAAGLVAFPTVAAYEDAVDAEEALRGLPVSARESQLRGGDLRAERGRGVRTAGVAMRWEDALVPAGRPEAGASAAGTGVSVEDGGSLVTHDRAASDGPAGGYRGPVAGDSVSAAGVLVPPDEPASFIGGAVASGLGRDDRGGLSMPPTPASARGPVKVSGRVSSRSAGALPVGGGRSREVRRPRSRRRRIVIVGLLGALLAGGAYGGSVVLPAADIVVTPVAELAGPVTMAVTADPEATAVNADEAVVPARRIEVPLEVSGEFPATGIRVDKTPATGTVRFASNNPLDPVTIPAGTTVATSSGVQFQVVATVVAPKATISGTTITAGKVDAKVEAVEPGTEGNVPAHAIKVVPQRLANFLVSVDNPAATSGGTRTETKLVTKEDYDGALRELTARLDASIEPAISDPAVAPEGMTVFPETAQRTKSTAVPTSKAIVGDEVESFTLTLTATASATAVDQTQLAPLAEERLKASVPEGYELFADSIRTEVGEGTVDGEVVTFTVKASGERYRKLDSAELMAAAKGKTIDEAKAALARYGEVVITPWPDFMGSVSSLDARITITIRPPQRMGQ